MITGTMPVTARRQQAEERLRVIRNALEVADDELERAFVEKDWETLGFDSWESYCSAIPEFHHFKMKAQPRRERVAKLRAQGANIPQIRAATGASLGTIHGDVKLLEGGHSREPVSFLKDEQPPQPAEQPVPTPPAPVSNVARAVALVAAQGTRGLTVQELCREASWHHGQSSSALTKAHQRGLLVRSDSYRQRCAVYLPTKEMR